MHTQMFGIRARKEEIKMPNHVRNVLTFKDLTKDEKEFILERFTTYNEEYGEREFDFNTIIPEPRYKRECPKDCLVTDKSHIEGDKARPWFDWYEWHNKYWGTKWGAYDGITYDLLDSVEFQFDTAWSAPYPVYEQLAARYPNFRWDVKYCDECGGGNCGHIVHFEGKTECHEAKDMSEDELYKELWGGDE